MGQIIPNSYKFKQLEIAYDSLKNAGYDYDHISEKVEEEFASEGYYPKLVGQKWKFKYRGN